MSKSGFILPARASLPGRGRSWSCPSPPPTLCAPSATGRSPPARGVQGGVQGGQRVRSRGSGGGPPTTRAVPASPSLFRRVLLQGELRRLRA
eukprot:1462216-Pyramimonas_sp.AAC.1